MSCGVHRTNLRLFWHVSVSATFYICCSMCGWERKLDIRQIVMESGSCWWTIPMVIVEMVCGVNQDRVKQILVRGTEKAQNSKPTQKGMQSEIQKRVRIEKQRDHNYECDPWPMSMTFKITLKATERHSLTLTMSMAVILAVTLDLWPMPWLSARMRVWLWRWP